MKLLKAEAGVNDGKAGLLSAAGLFAKGGIFDKKSESFNIQELDPYLLFDARSSMLGTLENPTLDLDPATPSTLDVITATRASVATRTLPDGTIASAEQDTVRVDYTQGAELTPTKFQQLEQTDFSLWAHARTSGTANAAISPDGQNNATYVEQNAGQTNAGSIYRFDAAVTGVFTLSVYAKKKEKDFIVLYDLNTERAYFNLETGTVGTVQGGNTANIEDAGNGWFRCSVTFTASSGGVKAFYVGDTDNSLTVTDSGGIYVWGPQLEEGTTASSFVANTTGSPKFLSSATYEDRVPMILVEPSATNLISYSEDFSQWSASNVDIFDGIPSPDGLTNARNIQPSATSGSHLIGFYEASSAIKTYSVYAKANGYKYFRFNTGSSSNGYAEFDVESGAVVGAGGTYYSTSSIEDVGDGWFRCSMTFSAGAATTIYIVLEDNTRSSSFIGDGTSGVYLWGAQVETGSVATSLIPTSGGNAAARTRAADGLVISGSDFTDFYNTGGDGTFYAEFTQTQTEIVSYLLNGGSYNSRFFYSNNSSTLINSYDGSTGPSRGTITINQLQRAAMSYNASTCSLSLNGSSNGITSTNGNFGLATKLVIGGGPSNNLHLNGHIKRLIYWPYHSDSL